MAKKLRDRLHLHINLGTLVFLFIVIYLMAYVITYLGKDKLAIYEVSRSDITDTVAGTGVILRDETLVSTTQDGYVNYYVPDGSMVGKNETVYTLDQTGKLAKYIKSLLADKSEVSDEEKSRIVEDLRAFGESYNDNDFSLVYEAENNLSQDLLTRTDTILSDNKEEILEECGEDSYVEVASTKEGLVSFSSDGLEGLKQKNVSESTFTDRKKMEDLRSDKSRKSGSPVYRLVEGQDWQLMVPVSKGDYSHLKSMQKEQSTLSVTFHKDSFSTTASYRCVKKKGEYYVLLSFDNYIQRYLNQRYLYVEMTVSETEGLKIPSSSLVKKAVYKIPKKYLTNGSNSSQKDQLNILKTTKKGEELLTQTSVEIYRSDDTYAWVLSDNLKKGIVISDVDKKEKFTLKNTTDIQGVFIVNRGYTVFKQVEIIQRNEDYCIVSADDSGIELYDRIILNSDTVKEDQVIY